MIKKSIVCMVCCVLAASFAGAADRFWIGSGTGSFTNPLSWDTAPVAGDRPVLNTTNTTVNYDLNGSTSPTYRGFSLASASGVTNSVLNVFNGTLNIGDRSGNSDGLTVAGNTASILNSSALLNFSNVIVNLTKIGSGNPNFNLGNGGIGTKGEVVVDGGSVINIGRSLALGRASGGIGMLTILDGDVNVNVMLTNNATLTVASGSVIDIYNGTLTVLGMDYSTTAATWVDDGRLIAFGGAEGKEIEIVYNGTDTIISAIPEPAAVGLFLFGGAAAFWIRRVRR